MCVEEVVAEGVTFEDASVSQSDHSGSCLGRHEARGSGQEGLLGGIGPLPHPKGEILGAGG
jgi:hypothetical protein